MLYLLIVDDEKTTRDSLKDVIPWNELGVDSVKVAKNGIEALELARDNQPDILLTDVRMPKMDGLELARQVRKLYPECKIIFLSGYADKDYLKSAIQLKAVSYIEKPINQREIESVIRETVSVCNEERQRNIAITQLKDSINSSKPLIRQEITLELVKGNTNLSGLMAKYSELPFKILQDNGFTIAYASINWRNNLEHKKAAAYQRLFKQLLYDDTFANPDDYLAGFDVHENIIVITFKNITPKMPGSENIIHQLFKALTELSEGDFDVAIGVGNYVKSVAQIPESYQNAILASNRQFYGEANHIYYITDSCNTIPIEIGRHLSTQFKEALQKEELGVAKELIQNLTTKVSAAKDPDINHVKNIYFHLLLILFEVALERGLIDPFNSKQRNYIWHEIEEKKNLAQLAEYVISSVQSIFSLINEVDAVNKKAYEIIRFIRDNYAAKDLSVQFIGNHVYLSPTYLCAFFKKASGKTLNEFITEVRMEKAKELLKNSRAKLYEIANKVGFTDVNYFSTLFKRYAGSTPSEFRERCR